MISNWGRLVAALALGASVGLMAPRAEAQSLAETLHDLVRVGGKVCLKDHAHYGEGYGASRRVAELSAISSWQGFTAWEYGNAWGSYRLAEGKSMRCGTGPAGWTCAVDARPCRRR